MTVYVAPSIYRSIDPRTMTAIMSAITSAPQHERIIWEPLWNDALIARSRSMLATNFLENYPDADVMVVIDDDVVFEPQDFWKIVEGCRETQGIYGGAYVTRSTTPHLSSSFWPQSGDGTLVFRETPERRPVNLEYLATGFWAVHRTVLEAMRDAEFRDANGTHRLHRVTRGANQGFIPFFMPFIVEEGEGRYHYLSEDWAFGERARQVGKESYCDLSIILVHMGLYPYSVKDINPENMGALTGLPSTGTELLEVESGPNDTGDPLIDNLIRDVAEFCEDDEGEIRRRMERGSEYVFELWAQRTEPESDWYRREDVGLAYLTDIASWHLWRTGAMSMHYRDIYPTLTGKHVLDYGAGIGTNALMAAREGAIVIAYEPNPVMREFIEWRAERYGIAIEVVGTLGWVPPLDAVICWHVFEHLTEPEATVGWIANYLKPSGVLISESGFEDQDTPMHHAHPNWDGVLARYGFEGDGPTYRLASVAVPA